MKCRRITKALLALILSSAIIFAITVPAFALTGNINYQTNNNVLGVKESCTGHFNSSNARSTIVLTFLPNAVHPPEEDFWCYTVMDLHETNALHHYTPAGGHLSSDTGLKNTSAMTITAAEFYYTVNDVEIYSQTF